LQLVTLCIEHGARALLLDERTTPAAFFNLASGFAGELLHKLGMYRIRLAVVVPDLARHPNRFQEFARESNTRGDCRFFPDRAAALEWLD
jgi:hypothetical protein